MSVLFRPSRLPVHVSCVQTARSGSTVASHEKRCPYALRREAGYSEEGVVAVLCCYPPGVWLPRVGSLGDHEKHWPGLSFLRTQQGVRIQLASCARLVAIGG